MQVQAFLKNFRMSPQKVREVARQIQGLPAEEAIQLLRFIPRKSARLLAKTLASAIANAENNHNLSSSDLVIVSATVNQGTTDVDSPTASAVGASSSPLSAWFSS